MTNITKIIVFLTLLLSPLAMSAQRSGYVISAKNAEAAVSENYVRNVVYYLSSESLGGRGCCTEGSAAAARWIADEFKNASLENMGGTYLHGFRMSGGLARNVIGYLPGSSDGWVIVMAHFDDLGKLGNTFFPGADSNASGVAALLQIVKMFARMKECHKTYSRSILFVALDGKEDDLAGASDLWRRIQDGRLGFSAQDVALVVNLDQLGGTSAPLTKGNPDYLMMLSEERGCRREELLSAAKSQHINLEIGFDYYGSKDFTNLFYRKISDQKIFLDNGIPSVMFTSGITMLNNKPGDTPETLDYPVLVKRIRLIFHYLDRVL